MKINITYKNIDTNKIYKQVSVEEALKLSSIKEEVKMFHFKLKPLRIAMVTNIDNELVIGKYNK